MCLWASNQSLFEVLGPDVLVAVMRRLIVSNFVSLDGLMAGPNGELDWFVQEGWEDAEHGDYVRGLLGSVDAILVGRLTYNEFHGYFPTATDKDPIVDYLNKLEKVVFSKTMDKVDWGKWNTARLVKGDPADEVRRLKAEPGKDLVIFGSGQLVSALVKARLVDELHMILRPIVLGKGKPEFVGLVERYKLTLIESKQFKDGAVWLRYKPA